MYIAVGAQESRMKEILGDFQAWVRGNRSRDVSKQLFDSSRDTSVKIGSSYIFDLKKEYVVSLIKLDGGKCLEYMYNFSLCKECFCKVICRYNYEWILPT